MWLVTLLGKKVYIIGWTPWNTEMEQIYKRIRCHKIINKQCLEKFQEFLKPVFRLCVRNCMASFLDDRFIAFWIHSHASDSVRGRFSPFNASIEIKNTGEWVAALANFELLFKIRASKLLLFKLSNPLSLARVNQCSIMLENFGPNQNFPREILQILDMLWILSEIKLSVSILVALSLDSLDVLFR